MKYTIAFLLLINVASLSYYLVNATFSGNSAQHSTVVVTKVPVEYYTSMKSDSVRCVWNTKGDTLSFNVFQKDSSFICNFKGKVYKIVGVKDRGHVKKLITEAMYYGKL